jgi:hypothetical protein
MRKIVGAFVAVLAVNTIVLSADQKAQVMTVKVIDMQNSETEYSGVLPGSVHTNVYGNSINSTVTPPRAIAYNVTGATLQLQLPDGRIAVVNCASKYSLKFDYVNRRSCRVPTENIIDVQFKGSDAKLFWWEVAGLDERRAQSETYKLIAVQK